jgi:heterodisulfide reductase subunit A2
MNEEVRIGVFVCDCGSNIAAVVDVPDVVNYAGNLPGVVFADEGKWSCSVDALSAMQGSIKEHGINRVVIASCTPRTHEPLFKRTVKEAGLNPYLLEFVSIREQVSWVHMHEPEAATAKAKDLVKMGVAKAALLEEGEEIHLPVGTDCLVVGGGLSGMTAALHVAAQGFHAVIVEKEAELGGLLNRLASVHYGQETIEARELVEETRTKIAAEPMIFVYTGATIESVAGYIGNYSVKVSTNGSSKEFGVSTVIVATGMRESVPEGLFLYHEDPRVKTQIELEGMLRNGGLGEPASVVMINCVNSKNETRGCCNIGCSVSVKNATAIKKQSPDTEVAILYRDLSLVKEEHFQLEEARAHGVRFMRFANDRYPEVTGAPESLMVRVHDVLLDRDFDLPSDLLVLTTGYTGDETVNEIKGHLKVSCDADGFFQERHIKLGPLDFPTSGISLCGCARSPKTLKESCEEAVGAAMRASIPMKNGFIEAEGIVAEIDRSLCNDCGLCWKRCPYSAIELEEGKHPRVIKALCKGCGLCAADCPKECITIVHYSDKQILAQIEAALEESPEKKIITFVCHWCALGGVDMAGVSRLQYPTNARLIRVMCSARVSIKMIQHAFELGAAGVLVAGCEFPTCHYISGNYAAETRLKRTKRILAKNGFDPEKLWNVWCSAADGPKFAATMRDMVRELGLEKEGS